MAVIIWSGSLLDTDFSEWVQNTKNFFGGLQAVGQKQNFLLATKKKGEGACGASPFTTQKVKGARFPRGVMPLKPFCAS